MSIGAWLAALEDFPGDLAQGVIAANKEAEGVTLDETLHLLAAIRDARAELAVVAQAIEAAALKAMPYRHVVEGLGEFVKHKGTKRTEWDNEGLTSKLVALALDERQIDPETGEVLESEAQCVARVLSECARPTWRLTPLRARKIAVDEYCSEREGTPSIELPKRRER